MRLKLGDVLTIRNGKTVEIHNTDAEGRLVLADGLSLAVEDKVDAIVDIATLTGAVLGALGKKLAGVFGNEQAWVDQVLAAAGRTDERAWQLPLVDDYRKLLDSNVADMKNVGGPYGGAILAGVVPAGVRRRRALGPPRHRRRHGQRRRRRHLHEGLDGLRRAAVRRAADQLHAAPLSPSPTAAQAEVGSGA